MASANAPLCARIAPLEPPYAPEARAMLEKWMPPNAPMEPLVLFRTLLRHGALSERMRRLGALLLGHGLLPMRVRELLILRTCARCGAEYEWGVHVTAFSAAARIDEERVSQTVTAPAAGALDVGEEDAPLLAFADELHDTGSVSEATWSALAARFEPSQLLEMIAVVGYYHLISFLTNGVRLPLEPWAARFPKPG